jgi:hypothetical protein
MGVSVCGSVGTVRMLSCEQMGVVWGRGGARGGGGIHGPEHGIDIVMYGSTPPHTWSPDHTHTPHPRTHGCLLLLFRRRTLNPSRAAWSVSSWSAVRWSEWWLCV